MAVTLKKQTIIDQYAVVIEDGYGGGQKFFDDVQKKLHDANMPNVSFEMVQVVTRRLFGGRGRDYLLVTHKFLTKFRMYISARDYGSYLEVTWALTLEPSMLGRQISKMVTGSGYGITFASHDLFTQQELDAYTVITHRAVVETVKGLVESMNQDFSKINTRSRSGLAAW